MALSFDGATIANINVGVGATVDVTLPEASGGVGANTYFLSPVLPGGLTFTEATRKLAGTTTGRFSLATFTYTATDTENTSVELTFTIVVTADAIAFVPADIANKVWTEEVAVSETLPRAMGGVGTITYSLSPTVLPAGVNLNLGTRRLSGLPSEAFEAMTFRWIATDGEGVTAFLEFSIRVNPVYSPKPVTVLPRSASRLEADLVDIYSQRQKNALLYEGDIPVRHLWNADTCPSEMLAYLECSMSVHGDAVDFSETQRRNFIKKSLEIHKKKGTIGSIKAVVEALGYRLATMNGIREGTDGHWANYRIVMESPLSIANANALEKLIEGTAPLRCNLTSFSSETVHPYDGTIQYDGMFTYGVITTQ
ncbi:phage tail protein I [Candidatus Poribacteria bacterium]|nr:phage tail protein I [Candidatus Poribacteria bacterium]